MISHLRVGALALGIALLASPALAQDRAFPSCQGGGCGATGGRGGSLCFVTNTNDSGAGSLRNCLQTSGARTIIFRTGGTVTLASTIGIFDPNLTVAGQTAPGGGFQISGKNLDSDSQASMLQISANNMIFRYLRVRKGFSTFCYNNPNPGCGATYNIIAYVGSTVNVENIILDHNSAGFNTDEGVGIWDNAAGSGSVVRNMTVQYHIQAWPLDTHPTCYLIGANSSGDLAAMTNLDFHHNMCAFAGNRQPAIQGPKSGRFVNNITYSWHGVAITQSESGTTWDVIGNHYKRGTGNSTHPISVYNGSTYANDDTFYLSGNTGPEQSNPAGDQWLLTAVTTGFQGSETTTPIPSQYRRASPQADHSWPITAEAVTGLEASLLPIVGASRRLDCDGTWIDARDSVDTSVVSNYNANTGTIIANESTVGGIPSLAAGTPCTDSDNDGMPNTWETARGLNPNSATGNDGNNGTNLATTDCGGDCTGAGDWYTNLELYLSWPEFAEEQQADPFEHCGQFDVDPETGTRGGMMPPPWELPYGPSVGTEDALGQKIWPDCATLQIYFGADGAGQTYGACAQDATGAACDQNVFFAPTALIRVTGSGQSPRWVQRPLVCASETGADNPPNDCSAGGGEVAGQGFLGDRVKVDLSQATLVAAGVIPSGTNPADVINLVRIRYCGDADQNGTCDNNENVYIAQVFEP